MADIPVPLQGTLGDPLQNETKSLDEVIRLAVEGILYNLHTALPCKVTRVRNNSYVDIQPLLQRRYTVGGLVTLPVIQMVPISQPRGADYWVKLPVAVGDLGMAIFSERSIDSWKVAGGLTDPKDTRRHDLSDAVFFPGVYPMNNTVPGAASDMVLHNGVADIYLQKTGKFLVQKEGGDELLAQISALADAVQSLAGAVAGGFTIISPITLAAQIIAATTASSSAGTIKGKVEGLTGST